MLIPLTDLIEKHNLKIRGVIHVGSHKGEEMPTYLSLGLKDIVLIEPMRESFDVLRGKYNFHAKLFNVACADYEGMQEMWIETDNDGQSNSLLKPKLHLTQHPDIKFKGTRAVNVSRLDKLGLDVGLYNFLNMDVQGAELMVLKGATDILHHIDYIYTEVNFDETYEKCPLVTDIDSFLSKYKFERVETFNGTDIWGDALYIKK